VQVPQKFYTPPTFEKSWNQRQFNSAKIRRMSLPFSHGIRCGSAGGPSHYSNIPMAILETVLQESQNAKQYTAGRRAPSVPQINQQEEYNSSFECAEVATTLPLYSPQDARSDLLRSSIPRSPATKGSPEMKRPKRKSAKSSPKKSKPAVKEEKANETIAGPTKPGKKFDMTNKERTSEISEINTDAPTKLAEDADATPNPAEEKPLSDATPTSTESQIIMERAHESPVHSIQSDEQAVPVHVLETTVLHQEVSTITKSLEKLAHPQTPIKDALICEYPAIYHTPDVEVASEDDQKQDVSFHSAKESQSPKSDGKGDIKSFTEATIMISREDQAVPSQGSDVEAEEESEQKKQASEHETLRSGIADTEIVISRSQLPIEPPLDINKALAISALPPNSGVGETESLHPFAKAKQQKQPQSKKKGSKKKEKGKEAELPKPKIAESSTSKEAEPTKPKTVESTMFTETRVDLDSFSISEAGSIKGKHGQSTQDSEADVVEEETLLEPTLNSGSDSTPSSKGKQESEPIDGKGSSFSQLGETKAQVVVPSPNLQDVLVTLTPKEQNESLAENPRLGINQNLEAARQEGEKEKKRKAIAAKVAIPHIKLRSTRLPPTTVKSDSVEARSPLTQITHVTPNEDTAFPLTDNKSTFADSSVSEPMKAEARQQIPDPPSRSNTSAEQDVDGIEIVGINQDASGAIPPTSSNDGLQPDDVVSLSAETPLSTMPITASLGQAAAQPIDPLQPVTHPRIKSKKPKKKKNKTAATPEGGTLDTSPITQPTTQQAEEAQSTSAIDGGIEFGEQKMMIDSMTKGRKSSVSYYDKMHLEERSPKAREASQSTDKGKAKARSAKEQANMSSLTSKVDRSAELAKLYEELTAELARQDLFDPESTERKNSIVKIQMLRIAIDARQEANISSRSRGLDPEMVKVVMGYKMTGDTASEHFTTSKQSQGEETPPISLVKDYYTVKENEYIGKPVRKKNVDSEESGAEEPGVYCTMKACP
jgi:hypothetical protein